MQEQPEDRIIRLVVFLQFIPALIFPPSTLLAANILLLPPLLLFALLGWGLLRHRPWARLMSIFVQGINITVRLMLLFPHATRPQGGVDLVFIICNLLAIVISGVFMYLLDRAEVQLAFEA